MSSPRTTVLSFSIVKQRSFKFSVSFFRQPLNLNRVLPIGQGFSENIRRRADSSPHTTTRDCEQQKCGESRAMYAQIPKVSMTIYSAIDTRRSAIATMAPSARDAGPS
jgi:hypothetical protein